MKVSVGLYLHVYLGNRRAFTWHFLWSWYHRDLETMWRYHRIQGHQLVQSLSHLAGVRPHGVLETQSSWTTWQYQMVSKLSHYPRNTGKYFLNILTSSCRVRKVKWLFIPCIMHTRPVGETYLEIAKNWPGKLYIKRYSYFINYQRQILNSNFFLDIQKWPENQPNFCPKILCKVYLV